MQMHLGLFNKTNYGLRAFAIAHTKLECYFCLLSNKYRFIVAANNYKYVL